MKLLPIALAAALALPAYAQQAAKSSGGGVLATVNGVTVPRSRGEIMLRERVAQGAPDNEQTRAAVRDELINREVLLQEANRAGLPKKAEIQTELELVRQSFLVQVFLRDYVRANPVSDADIQKEYERAKAEAGDKEYKARHILVDKEDEAKGLIADLKKGAKFEELAQKNSKDTGNKERGGDLGWNVPSVFDKVFSDAMVKLDKGKYTDSPVQTRFGYHVIQLDDVRPVKFPALQQVQPQIRQRLTQLKIDKLIGDLRAKAKVE